MYEIRKGLKEGLDVSKYADPKYNDDQMEQILLGLEEECDKNFDHNTNNLSSEDEEEDER